MLRRRIDLRNNSRTTPTTLNLKEYPPHGDKHAILIPHWMCLHLHGEDRSVFPEIGIRMDAYADGTMVATPEYFAQPEYREALDIVGEVLFSLDSPKKLSVYSAEIERLATS